MYVSYCEVCGKDSWHYTDGECAECLYREDKKRDKRLK